PRHCPPGFHAPFLRLRFLTDSRFVSRKFFEHRNLYRDGLRLILVAEPLEALLHLVHLAFEIVNLAAAACVLRQLVRIGGGLLAARKRREHGKRTLEHLHVPPHLILERSERTPPKCLRHLLTEFFLFAGERFNRHFEITGDEHLHAVAVKPNEL